MKKLLTLFMCFALVGLYSCSSDDDDNGDGNGTGITVKARVLYSTDANGIDTKPDAGAKVYLHYDFNYKNANGYEYQGNGKYKKGDLVLEPAQTATVDSEGNAVIEQKFKNRELTVVVESKHYAGRYSETYYETFNENIISSTNFRPE